MIEVDFITNIFDALQVQNALLMEEEISRNHQSSLPDFFSFAMTGLQVNQKKISCYWKGEGVYFHFFFFWNTNYIPSLLLYQDIADVYGKESGQYLNATRITLMALEQV